MVERYEMLKRHMTATINAESTLRTKLAAIQISSISSCADLVTISENLLAAVQDENTISTEDYTSTISKLSTCV